MSKLSEFLTNIANAIRNLKGTTEPINAQNFANEINDMKEALDDTNATPQDIVVGKTAYVKGEKITGTYKTPTSLKKLLDNSKSTSYMFYSNKTVTDLTGYIQYEDTSEVTDMSHMFQESNIQVFPLLNTSKVTDMNGMFANTTIKIVQFEDTSNVTNMFNMFNGSNITTIINLDMRSVTSNSNMFWACIPLTNVTVLNIKIDLQVGSAIFGKLLTLDSLIGLCQECVNVNASRTLTVGSVNITKLANVYVKLTNQPEEDETLPKLPMVQCESTDEGAMTISQYMALKNWQLA